MNSYPPYSVLMSIYAKENPSFFAESLTCMARQTVPPAELIIVCDGPLTDALYGVLDAYESAVSFPVRRIQLPMNAGLGNALSVGVPLCENELIARMDADDLCMPDRMEKQLACFINDPELGMVGSNATEFIDDPLHPVALVSLPEKHEEIVKFSGKRCAFRHPALLFKKSAVLHAGNYSSKYLRFEDLDLLGRMIATGCKCYNIQENLIQVRISADFYERRGGFDYLWAMLCAKFSLVRIGVSSPLDFVVSAGGQVVVCLLPNKIRKKFYMRFLRSGVN